MISFTVKWDAGSERWVVDIYMGGDYAGIRVFNTTDEMFKFVNKCKNYRSAMIGDVSDW